MKEKQYLVCYLAILLACLVAIKGEQQQQRQQHQQHEQKLQQNHHQQRQLKRSAAKTDSERAKSEEIQQNAETQDKPRFSIGLGTLSPSYTQKFGADGKTKLDFNHEKDGFSYSITNTAHPTGIYVTQTKPLVSEEDKPNYQHHANYKRRDPNVNIYHTQGHAPYPGQINQYNAPLYSNLNNYPPVHSPPLVSHSSSTPYAPQPAAHSTVHAPSPAYTDQSVPESQQGAYFNPYVVNVDHSIGNTHSHNPDEGQQIRRESKEERPVYQGNYNYGVNPNQYSYPNYPLSSVNYPMIQQGSHYNPSYANAYPPYSRSAFSYDPYSSAGYGGYGSFPLMGTPSSPLGSMTPGLNTYF